MLKFMVLASLLCSACSKSITMKNFPSPFANPVACGGNIHKRSFICDRAKLLEPKQREMLNTMIKQIENSTKCVCTECLPGQHGFKVGIAIIDTVPIIRGKGRGASLVQFGDYVRSSWRFGSCGDDILVVLAIKDKKVYSSRGSKIMKILSSKVLREIYEEEGDKLYSFDGVKNMLSSFKTSFKDSQDPAKQNLPYIIGGVIAGVILLILIIVCIVSSCRRKNRNKHRTSTKDPPSEAMKKKIAAFENPTPYSKKEYRQVKLDEPDNTFV